VTTTHAANAALIRSPGRKAIDPIRAFDSDKFEAIANQALNCIDNNDSANDIE
jgi:hypothetical protein